MSHDELNNDYGKMISNHETVGKIIMINLILSILKTPQIIGKLMINPIRLILNTP